MPSDEKKSKEENYHRPRIGQFLKAICEQYSLDEDQVLAFVSSSFPELHDKTTCANCGASMAQYVFTLDVLDALLLMGMGKIVRERAKTMPFSEANKVHVQKELNQYYSVASRTTQCSKLGLITKVLHPDGSHNQKAGWLITRRGFQFLAGKPVPRRVQTFRNKITERFDETTTFDQVLTDTSSNDERVLNELTTHGKYQFNDLETWAIAGFDQGTLL